MSRPAHQQSSLQDEDPLNPKVAASALDFLLIELVPLAQRITEQLLAREQALIDEHQRSRIFNRTALKGPAKSVVDVSSGGGGGGGGGNGGDGNEGGGRQGVAVVNGGTTAVEMGGREEEEEEGQGITSLGFPVMTESTREGVFHRLDGMGYRVGQGLVER